MKKIFSKLCSLVLFFGLGLGISNVQANATVQNTHTYFYAIKGADWGTTDTSAKITTLQFSSNLSSSVPSALVTIGGSEYWQWDIPGIPQNDFQIQNYRDNGWRGSIYNIPKANYGVTWDAVIWNPTVSGTVNTGYNAGTHNFTFTDNSVLLTPATHEYAEIPMTWDLNYSSAPSYLPDATVYPNEKIVQPANPSRTNYQFKGWYADSQGVGLWNFQSDLVPTVTNIPDPEYVPETDHDIWPTIEVPLESFTLYASWEFNPLSQDILYFYFTPEAYGWETGGLVQIYNPGSGDKNLVPTGVPHEYSLSTTGLTMSGQIVLKTQNNSSNGVKGNAYNMTPNWSQYKVTWNRFVYTGPVIDANAGSNGKWSVDARPVVHERTLDFAFFKNSVGWTPRLHIFSSTIGTLDTWINLAYTPEYGVYNATVTLYSYGDLNVGKLGFVLRAHDNPNYPTTAADGVEFYDRFIDLSYPNYNDSDNKTLVVSTFGGERRVVIQGEDYIAGLGDSFNSIRLTYTGTSSEDWAINPAATGLRFRFNYTKEADEEIESAGMYLIPRNLLTAQYPTINAYKTALGLYGSENLDSSLIDFQAVNYLDEAVYSFSTVLLNIPSSQYSREIVALPYLNVVADTEHFTIFGEEISTSLKAQANLLLAQEEYELTSAQIFLLGILGA